VRRTARTTADRYGDIGASAEWNLVLEHYRWDRVIEAHRLSVELGAAYGASVLGWYRLVEGEAVTRGRSQIISPTDWLQVEFIENEVEGGEELARFIQEVCQQVDQKLAWQGGSPTMVSVLAHEADAPWHGSRFGYFVDKNPFDKICIPLAACQSEHRLRETIEHEYTHLVVHNRAEGRAPDWLQEGIAMLVEGEELDAAARPFRTGGAAWLNPEDLNRAFHAERRDAAVYGRVWHAYQQAAVLGHFLLTRQGWEGIGRLLDAFSNNTFWQELKLTVTGEPTVDEALKEVFAFGATDLFKTALEWIRADSH
jgi:hypothetical protein